MAKLLLNLSDSGHLLVNRREYSINDMAARVATVLEDVSRRLIFLRDKVGVTSPRTEIVLIQAEGFAGIAQLDSDSVLYG